MAKKLSEIFPQMAKRDSGPTRHPPTNKAARDTAQAGRQASKPQPAQAGKQGGKGKAKEAPHDPIAKGYIKL